MPWTNLRGMARPTNATSPKPAWRCSIPTFSHPSRTLQPQPLPRHAENPQGLTQIARPSHTIPRGVARDYPVLQRVSLPLAVAIPVHHASDARWHVISVSGHTAELGRSIGGLAARSEATRDAAGEGASPRPAIGGRLAVSDFFTRRRLLRADQLSTGLYPKDFVSSRWVRRYFKAWAARWRPVRLLRRVRGWWRPSWPGIAGLPGWVCRVRR